ncbi:MAG: hypothetical protein LBU32_13930 [Clostridiales bacterium]|nr:hypothetical protein [Clostridiales bacterium]
MRDLLLLSKDAPIAKISDGAIDAIEPARLPLLLQRWAMPKHGWNQGRLTSIEPTRACSSAPCVWSIKTT